MNLFPHVIFEFIGFNYMEIISLGFFLRLELLSLGNFVILCWGYWFIRGLIFLMDIREIGFPSELFHFVMSFVLSLDVL